MLERVIKQIYQIINSKSQKLYLANFYKFLIQWHGLTREEQATYYEKARVERQKHMQMYPHWNARDNYRFGTKKKKRTKREKACDASKGMYIQGRLNLLIYCLLITISDDN